MLWNAFEQNLKGDEFEQLLNTVEIDRQTLKKNSIDSLISLYEHLAQFYASQSDFPLAEQVIARVTMIITKLNCMAKVTLYSLISS